MLYDPIDALAKRFFHKEMSSSSRITIYLPSLVGGGAERTIVTLANGFIQLGYLVDLVLAKAAGPYLPDVDSKVNVVELQSSKLLKLLFSENFVVCAVPDLVRYIRRERPSTMLCALDAANVTAIWAKFLSGIRFRIVVSQHNVIRATKRNPFRLSWHIPWTYALADEVVAVSEGVARNLSHATGIASEKINVIYNPVDLPRIKDRSKEVAEWSGFNIHKDSYILAVGRLAEQKDFPTLIRAFNILRKTKPNLKLIILGEGRLRSSLTRLISELELEQSVFLPGFVDNPFSWMRSAKVFVLSSAWEGFGNVIVEAMACGVPIVATDCPSGPAEILQHGKWGRLVPVGDERLLADAICQTLNDSVPPDVSQRAEEFGVANAVASYTSVLHGVLPGSKLN